MLSKNNTPSAKAFAEQRYRKADSLTECRQSEKHIEPDKGGYCQVTEKTDWFFWRERSLPPARFIRLSKNIPPIGYRNSIQTGSILLNVCCFSFVFVPTFPSVACFRCRRHPLYRREREKVFGLNTLRRRKILPETACRPTFSLSMKSVLTSMGGEEAGDRETGILIGRCPVFTSPCHQLIHILGDFIIGHFGIALCGPDVRVSHHLADTLDRHTYWKRQGSERMSACVVAEILFHAGQYAYLVDAVPKPVPVG